MSGLTGDKIFCICCFDGWVHKTGKYDAKLRELLIFLSLEGLYKSNTILVFHIPGIHKQLSHNSLNKQR